MYANSDICLTCKNTWEWHQEHHPRHKFNLSGTVSLFAQEPQPPAEPAATLLSTQNDPVLRQALIDKGILTPEDLAEAQRKIEAIVGSLLKGMTDDGTGGATVRSGTAQGT